MAPARTFAYDDRHKIVEEIDKRGFAESTEYGFHGRVVSGVRKDGTTIQLAAAETRGLYPEELTSSRVSAPSALAATELFAAVADGNGNSTEYRLDSFGRLRGDLH